MMLSVIDNVRRIEMNDDTKDLQRHKKLRGKRTEDPDWGRKMYLEFWWMNRIALVLAIIVAIKFFFFSE